MSRKKAEQQTKYQAVAKITLELSIPLDTQGDLKEAVEEALTFKSIEAFVEIQPDVEHWDSDVEITQVFKVSPTGEGRA